MAADNVNGNSRLGWRFAYDEGDRIRYHYVLIDYLCRPNSGALKAATDATEARWIKLTDVDQLSTTKTLKRLILQANLRDEGCLT